MAGKVEIANRALTKLGAERILLLTDPNKEARVMNSMFDTVMDAELRRHRWKFALKRATLPALVATPEWGYAYAYQLPADFLALVQVNEFYLRGLKQKTLWTVESGQILTDLAAPLKLRYIRRVDNMALLDPLFVEVLSCKLAFEACETLTQSGQKRQAAGEEYRFAVNEAVRQDAIENPPDELPWGSWLDSRESLATYAGGPSAGSVADLNTSWGIQ
jgi:hypothetical protein